MPTSMEVEIGLLDLLAKDRNALRRKTLADYLTEIAPLGGHPARVNDPLPGETVMWCSLPRLTGITSGLALRVFQSSAARSPLSSSEEDIDFLAVSFQRVDNDAPPHELSRGVCARPGALIEGGFFFVRRSNRPRAVHSPQATLADRFAVRILPAIPTAERSGRK